MLSVFKIGTILVSVQLHLCLMGTEKINILVVSPQSMPYGLEQTTEGRSVKILELLSSDRKIISKLKSVLMSTPPPSRERRPCGVLERKNLR